MIWKNEKQTLIYKNKRKIRNDRSTWLSAKLIKCFKPGSIKSIVRLERNSEEVSIRFDCFRYLETAVPWDFAVDRSIVWKLNIITSSFCCASKKSRRKKEKKNEMKDKLENAIKGLLLKNNDFDLLTAWLLQRQNKQMLCKPFQMNCHRKSNDILCL